MRVACSCVRCGWLPSAYRVRFSRHCGSNIRLSDDGRTATRVQGYNRGLILSEDKIPNDKVFEVSGSVRM